MFLLRVLLDLILGRSEHGRTARSQTLWITAAVISVLTLFRLGLVDRGVFDALAATVAVLSVAVSVASYFRYTKGPRSVRVVLRACDWAPTPKLRKKLRAMVGDQERDIKTLIRQRRYWAARWLHLCTWALFVWYFVWEPLVAVRQFIAGRFSDS